MDQSQLLRGALDAAVLAVVAENDGYGYDVLRRLRTAGMTEVGDASVYGTLRRLYRSGALTSYVMPSDEGPHRRYYGMTDRGPRPARGGASGLGRFFAHAFYPAQDRTGGDRMNGATTAPDDVGRYIGAVRDRWPTSPPTSATTFSSRSRHRSPMRPGTATRPWRLAWARPRSSPPSSARRQASMSLRLLGARSTRACVRSPAARLGTRLGAASSRSHATSRRSGGWPEATRPSGSSRSGSGPAGRSATRSSRASAGRRARSRAGRSRRRGVGRGRPLHAAP